MLGALTILLVFQLAGEALALAFGLPVPGPVIGMALLFAALAIRGSLSEPLRDTAQGLLAHLSVLFVPAGVGVMVHARLLADQWPALLAALLVSTVLTLGFTALLLKRLLARGGAHADREAP